MCALYTKKNSSPTAWASNFHLMLCIDNPSLSDHRIWVTQRAQTFVINKIVLMEPVLMFSVYYQLYVDSTILHHHIFTARQFSSQTAAGGRPDWSSSSRLLLSRRKSATQRLTVALWCLLHCYTTVIQLCICCGSTSSNVQNSITARQWILLKSVILSNQLQSVC